jgi:hypothetical protein
LLPFHLRFMAIVVSNAELPDMPLLAIWESNPKAVGDSTIEQIVAMAGDGNLKDATPCSNEFREYLTQAATQKLAGYIEHCLSSSFSKGGLVFQDLINELARRLDYQVKNGRYQGTTNSIGYDGIWTSPEGHAIIAEVKTTDAYRIPLDTIANYRRKLLDAGDVQSPSSILILVGRQDTGELEAQIRGSRHAWDIRLISADALLKLVQLKENSEDPETGTKIRNLLTPMEFTRLDTLVDVMFTTARDVETAILDSTEDNTETDGRAPEQEAITALSGWEFTDAKLLDKKRADIIDALSRNVSTKLIRKSRALFWDAAHAKRVACSISKRSTKGTYPYWFAFHPQWDEFLADGTESFFVLGCMDLEFAFAIPLDVLRSHLPALNTTTTARRTSGMSTSERWRPEPSQCNCPRAGPIFLLRGCEFPFQRSERRDASTVTSEQARRDRDDLAAIKTRLGRVESRLDGVESTLGRWSSRSTAWHEASPTSSVKPCAKRFARSANASADADGAHAFAR